MAKKTSQQTSADSEYEQMFPNWVYQVPGFFLILAGFGGLAFMNLA